MNKDIDPIRKHALELAISICRNGRNDIDTNKDILARAEAFYGFLTSKQPTLQSVKGEGQ